MNEKNLLDDITSKSLNELTDLADKIIKNLENEINLENKSEDYANLIKINKLIEKKFQKNFKEILEKSASLLKLVLLIGIAPYPQPAITRLNTLSSAFIPR